MTQIVYASGRNQLPSPGVIVQSGGSVPAGSYYFWLQAKNRVGYNSPSNPTLINVSSPSQLRIYIPGISYIAESEDWREFIVYASNNPNFSSSVPIGLFELYNADGVTTKPLAPNTFNASTPAQFVLNAPFLYNTEVEDYSNLDATAFFGKRHFVRALSQVYEKRASWVPVRSNKIVEDVANANTEVVFVDEDNFNITVVDYLEQRDSWVGFYVVPRNNRPIEANTRLTFQLFVDNENYTLRVPDAIEFSVQGVVNLSTFGINTNGITLPGTFRKYDPFVRNLFVERTINPGSALYIRIRLNLQASDFISRDLNKSRLKVLPVYNAEYFANYFDGNLFVGNMVFNTEERLLLEPRGSNTVYVGRGSASINGTTFRDRPPQTLSGFPSNTGQIPVYMNLIGDVYLQSRNTANEAQRAIVSTLGGYSLPAPFTASRVLPNDWTVTLRLIHRPDKIGPAASDIFLRDKEGIVGGTTTNKIVVIMNHSILGLRAASFTINPNATQTTLIVGGDSNWVPFDSNNLTMATRNLFQAVNLDVLSEGTGSSILGGIVSFSYAYFYDGTSISDINHSPLLGNIITQNLTFDELSISYEYFGNPVNRIQDLRAIPKEERRRLQIRVVSEGNAAYIYDTDNMVDDNGSTIIRPLDITSSRPGRWRRLNSTEWFTGSGNPPNGIGSVLDFYVDTQSYRLWQKRTLSSWSFLANLRQQFLIESRDPVVGDNQNSIYSARDLWFSTATRRLFVFDGSSWLSNFSGNSFLNPNKLGDRIIPAIRNPANTDRLPLGDLWLNSSTGTMFQQTSSNINSPNWEAIGTFRIEASRWLVGESVGYNGGFYSGEPFDIFTGSIYAPNYPTGTLAVPGIFNGTLGLLPTSNFDNYPIDEASVADRNPLPNDLAINKVTNTIYRRNLSNTWEVINNPRGTRVYYGNADPRQDPKLGSSDCQIRFINPNTSQVNYRLLRGAFAFGDIFHDLNTGNIYIHNGNYKNREDNNPGNNSWTLIGNYRYIGTRFFMQNGSPSSSLGEANDLYWDKATNDIYQKGTSGWQLMTTIRPARLTSELTFPTNNVRNGDINLNPNTGVISVATTNSLNQIEWQDKGSIRVNGAIFYHGLGHPETQTSTHPSRQALTGDFYLDTETGNLYKFDYPNLHIFLDSSNNSLQTPWLNVFTYAGAQFYTGFGEPTVSALPGVNQSHLVDIFINVPINTSLASRLGIYQYLTINQFDSIIWRNNPPVSADFFNIPNSLTSNYFPIRIILGAQSNPAENGFYIISSNADLSVPFSSLMQYKTPNDPIGLTTSIFVGPLSQDTGRNSFYEFRFLASGNLEVGVTPVQVREASPERYPRVTPKSYQRGRVVTNRQELVDPLIPFKTANPTLLNAIYLDLNSAHVYKATYKDHPNTALAGVYWEYQGSLDRKGTLLHTINIFERLGPFGEILIEYRDENRTLINAIEFHRKVAINDMVYVLNTRKLYIRKKYSNETNSGNFGEYIKTIFEKDYVELTAWKLPRSGFEDDFIFGGDLQVEVETLEGGGLLRRYYYPIGNVTVSNSQNAPMVGDVVIKRFETSSTERVVLYRIERIENNKAYVMVINDYLSGVRIQDEVESLYRPEWDNQIVQDGIEFNPTVPHLILDKKRGLVIRPIRGDRIGLDSYALPKYKWRMEVMGSFRGSRIIVGDLPPGSSGFQAHLNGILNTLYYSGTSTTHVNALQPNDYYFARNDESLYHFAPQPGFTGGTWQKIASMSGTNWFFGEGVPTLQTPGKDGDFYLDKLEGKIYVKILGIYQYTSNLQISGNTKFLLDTIPNNTLGDDGDIAINNITRFVYKKENGGWVFKTSLRGNFIRAGTFVPNGTTNLVIPNSVFPDPYINDLYFSLKNRTLYKSKQNSLTGTILWDKEGELLFNTIHRIPNINLLSFDGNPLGIEVAATVDSPAFRFMPGDYLIDTTARKVYYWNPINNTLTFISSLYGNRIQSGNFLPTGPTIPESVFPNQNEGDIYISLPNRSLYLASRNTTTNQIEWAIQSPALFNTIHSVYDVGIINLTTRQAPPAGGYPGFNLMPGDFVFEVPTGKLYEFPHGDTNLRFVATVRGNRIQPGEFIPTSPNSATIPASVYSDPAVGDVYLCRPNRSLYRARQGTSGIVWDKVGSHLINNIHRVYSISSINFAGANEEIGISVPATTNCPAFQLMRGDFVVEVATGRLYEWNQNPSGLTLIELAGSNTNLIGVYNNPSNLPATANTGDAALIVTSNGVHYYVYSSGSWKEEFKNQNLIGAYVNNSAPTVTANNGQIIFQITDNSIDCYRYNNGWQLIRTVISNGFRGVFNNATSLPTGNANDTALVLNSTQLSLYRFNGTSSSWQLETTLTGGSTGSSNFLGVFGSSSGLPASATSGNEALVISSAGVSSYLFNGTTWQLAHSFTGSGAGLIVVNSSNDLPSTAATGTKAIARDGNGRYLTIYERTATNWQSLLYFDMGLNPTKDIFKTIVTGFSTDFFGTPFQYDALLGDKASIEPQTSKTKDKNALTTNLDSDNQISLSPNGKLATISSFRNLSYTNLVNPFHCDQMLFWFDGTNKGDFEFRPIFQREFIQSSYCTRIAEPGSSNVLNFSSSNVAIKDSVIGSLVTNETTIPMKPNFLEQNCVLLRINLNLYVGNLNNNDLIISFNDLGLSLTKTSNTTYTLSGSSGTASLSLDNDYVDVFLDINPSTNQIVQYPSVSVNAIGLNEYDNYPTSSSSCVIGAKVIVQHISIMANPKNPSINPIELFDNYQVNNYHPLKNISVNFTQLDLNRESPSYIQTYGFDINSEKFDKLNQAVYAVRSITNSTLLLETSTFEFTSPTKCVTYLSEGGISIRNQNWYWHGVSSNNSFLVGFAFKLPYFVDNNPSGLANYFGSINLIELIYTDLSASNQNLYVFDSIKVPLSMIGNSLVYFVGYYNKNNNTFSYSFKPADLNSYQTKNLNANLHQMRLFNAFSHYQIKDGDGVNTGLAGVTTIESYQSNPSSFSGGCVYDIHLYEALLTENTNLTMKELYRYLKQKWGTNQITVDWLT